MTTRRELANTNVSLSHNAKAHLVTLAAEVGIALHQMGRVIIERALTERDWIDEAIKLHPDIELPEIVVTDAERTRCDPLQAVHETPSLGSVLRGILAVKRADDIETVVRTAEARRYEVLHLLPWK